MEMQRILGLGTTSADKGIVARPPDLKGLSSRSWAKLCGLLCAYRLADVVALLGGSKLNLRVPRSPNPPKKQLYVRFGASSISLMPN
jgi:hypothetical protein